MTSLKGLSNLSFPEEANILACMTEMSEYFISSRRENAQKRSQTVQQLQRQLIGKEPSSSISLMNRYVVAKERTDVMYDVLQVRVTKNGYTRLCLI